LLLVYYSHIAQLDTQRKARTVRGDCRTFTAIHNKTIQIIATIKSCQGGKRSGMKFNAV